jgi:hypothetical protein
MNRRVRGWGVGPAVGLTAALFLCVAPSAGLAQPSSLPAASGFAASVEALPAPYANPARALELLLPRIAAEPARIDLRFRAARELSALALTEETRDERMARVDQLEAEAIAAIGLDPLSASAHYWLAVACGIRADQSGGLAELRGAKCAHAEATTALRLDPRHPGANYVLGRLYLEAMSLSSVARLMARAFGLGDAIADASWEGSEEHLRIAVKGEPDLWLHELDLARLLLRRERTDEAHALLRKMAGRTPRSDLDRFIRAAALAELPSVP